MNGKPMIVILAAAMAAVLILACGGQTGIDYPQTKKGDQVDDYFGTKVADPYRWLEDDQAAEVKQWVIAQNKVTDAYLEKIPFRETIRRRIRETLNYPRYSQPIKAGRYYLFSKNDGLQDQSVYYIQQGLDGEAEVLLDPNTLSKDGTVGVGLAGISKDDRYLCFSRSDGGSDWKEFRVMELESREELPDRVRWIKFSGASWYKDGFFYSGYEAPKKGEELTAANRFNRVYFHKLGDPQAKDKVVFEDPEHPLRYIFASVTEDERFLLLYVSEGTHGNEIYYRDLEDPRGKILQLIKGFENNHQVIDNIGDRLLIQTDLDAPKGRLVLVDPAKPAPENWITFLAEGENAIQSVSLAGQRVFVSVLKDASTRTFQYDLEGNLEREIVYPALGSAGGFYGKKRDTTLFYTFTSFMYPPTIFRYDVEAGKSEVFRRSRVKFNPDDYAVKQVFYSSKDGTRVPMFIVNKKGLNLNGDNPTLLYGYGGFSASMTPYFSAGILVLLENGGVYAMANIRGGGEYGEEWHKAGMLQHKQSSFDDFIAAAEYLIAEKYTSSERLAIAGASNGGLLVGACMTQRPELFKVAFPAVGVMDMLRYHKFTVGWGWAVEYGSSDKEEDFRYLYAFSPLHNIKEGVNYPATLVTTADHDDRVVPAHSFKFIATLQEKHHGENPVLISIETRSGHGSSNLTKAIDSLTDRWSFMFFNMGVRICE